MKVTSHIQCFLNRKLATDYHLTAAVHAAEGVAAAVLWKIRTDCHFGSVYNNKFMTAVQASITVSQSKQGTQSSGHPH